MPATIAIPAILGAAGIGANVVTAKMSSDAAKSAAQQQQQSVNQAQQFAQQAWQQQQAALAPYQQQGATALNNLMSQYGSSNPALAAMRNNAFVNSAQQRNPMQGFPAPLLSQGPGQAPPLMPAPQGPMPSQGQPPSTSMASLGQPPQQNFGNGAMVKIQAPDGEVRQVPAALAPQFIARGAQRVM